jgi:hypothetical protein
MANRTPEQRIARARKQTPPKFIRVFDRVVSGKASKSECIRFQCAQCYGYFLPDSAACDNVVCPFLWQNPYRKRANKRANK